MRNVKHPYEPVGQIRGIRGALAQRTIVSNHAVNKVAREMRIQTAVDLWRVPPSSNTVGGGFEERRLRILVCLRNPLEQAVVGQILRIRTKHKIISAIGRSFEDNFRFWKPGLAILDQEENVMLIRTAQGAYDLPIIFLTNGSDNEREACYKLGVDLCVNRPLDFDDPEGLGGL